MIVALYRSIYCIDKYEVASSRRHRCRECRHIEGQHEFQVVEDPSAVVHASPFLVDFVSLPSIRVIARISLPGPGEGACLLSLH